MWNKSQTAAHNLSLSKWSNTIALVSNLRLNCFFAKDLVPTYLVPICENKVYCFCCSGTGITSFAIFFPPQFQAWHGKLPQGWESMSHLQSCRRYLQGWADMICRDILLHLNTLCGFWFTLLFYFSDLLFLSFLLLLPCSSSAAFQAFPAWKYCKEENFASYKKDNFPQH